MAQSSHHHHIPSHHLRQSCSTSKMWKHGKLGRSGKHYSKRGNPSSLLHAAGAAALRQKLVQFAMVLHLLQHLRPMVAYEQEEPMVAYEQQVLQQLSFIKDERNPLLPDHLNACGGSRTSPSCEQRKSGLRQRGSAQQHMHCGSRSQS
jgi:hypothetical protein